MSAKRALIVDDSRSARVILSRMLEVHGLQVDTAESGEQALEYLLSGRPDVVFMDHLMPGMDGFEAVRAMKTNTQTASIPVMMYTSQEGAHYLAEARRIGAIGVLSKTLKPTDVARALYELNLLPDRRDLPAMQSANAERIETPRPSPGLSGVAQFEAVKAAARPVEPRASTSGEIRALVATLVEEQQGELHQLLQSSLDAMSNRLNAELRATAQQIAIPRDAAPESGGARGWFAVALILVALVPTAVIAGLYWRTLNDNQAHLEQSASRLAMVVTDQQTQIEQLRAELRKHQEGAGEIVMPGPHAEVILVPYGELPLAGVRVQRMQAMVDRLIAEGFHGKLNVSSFAGDFCLTGNALNGYALAHDQLPIRRCDLIGNPYDDSLTAAQRQSPELVSAIANVSTKIRIEVMTQGRKSVVAYPPQTDKLTGGEWNRVAARNHRVEFTAVSD